MRDGEFMGVCNKVARYMPVYACFGSLFPVWLFLVTTDFRVGHYIQDSANQ